MGLPTCRGCGAVIRWIKSAAGKPIPCDPDKLSEWIDTDAPMADGPRITLVLPDGQVITGKHGSVITPGARAFEGYVSHFATCPKADQFRKGATA